MSYIFLQQYWWFVVSLLGALLVHLRRWLRLVVHFLHRFRCSTVRVSVVHTGCG